MDFAEKQIFNQQLQWFVDLRLIVKNCRYYNHKANHYEHFYLSKQSQHEQNSEESPAEPGVFEQVDVPPKAGYEQTHITNYSECSVYSD